MIRRPYQQSKFEGQAFSSGRIGATLVEVLMSLLIMSIGIVSVFSLFPVAILSSIKATQLTNGKLLQENVVELVRANPQLTEGYAPWKPNWTYNTSTDTNAPPGNKRVVPTGINGRPLSSVNYFYFSSGGGTSSGSVEPIWTGTPNDNGITWTSARFSGYAPDVAAGLPTSQQRVAYVVDPLGYWQMNSNGIWNVFDTSNTEVGIRYGNNDAGTAPYTNALPRLHADLSFASAKQYFTLPDSWTTVIEAVPSDVSNDTASSTPRPYVTFSPPVDLGTLSTDTRITVVSTDRTKSATRLVDPNYSTTSQTTLFAGDSFPAALDTPAEVGLARVEVYNRRYSYLLNVIRNPDGTANIQCPVFFNRSFSTTDERTFPATITSAAPDTINVDLSGVSLQPLISEGNYVYDARIGHWYKIASVSISGTAATVIIDRSAILLNSSGTTNTAVMFPPGIIKVFDIEL